MLNRSNLKPHQVKISKFIKEKAASGGCLCFLDMGAGKTICTIDALSQLHEEFCFHKGLVVSTKKIVQFIWPAEILKWEQGKCFKVATRETVLKAKNARGKEHREALEFKVEMGKKLQVTELKFLSSDIRKEYKRALKVIRESEVRYLTSLDANLYLINVENYVWLQETLGKHWFFDTQVFDESSLFRDPSSKRFKAAKKAVSMSQTSICLTGSPTPNGYANLWGQAYLVDEGARLGQFITQFRQNYCFQLGMSYVVTAGVTKVIEALLKDITISVDAKEWVQVKKEPIHEFFPVQFTPELKDGYQELKRDFILEVKDQEIVANSQAQKMNKLKQYCNGAVYTEDKEVIDVHDLKLEALKELVEFHSDEPIIVVYEYLSEKAKILKAFPYATTMDKFNQKAWDAKKIRMLVVHPKSGGHGLNLQHGGHILIWFSTTVDLELFQQMNGRINELRQTQSGYNIAPHYYHIYVKGTLEQSIIRQRNRKDITQRQLLEAMMEDLVDS